MFLMVCIAVAVSCQAFAAAPSTMSEERQVELKAELRAIVESQVGAVSGLTDALLTSDIVKDLLTNVIQGFLNTDVLKDLISGPALGDLIADALGDAIPGVDLGGVIGDVLSNEEISKIIVHVLENKYFNIFLDKTIDNILAVIQFSDFTDILFDAVIDNMTEKIWNNGNPTTMLIVGNWNNSGNQWNQLGIGITLVANGLGSIFGGDPAALIADANFDFADILVALDINLVLNAAKNALEDTFDEFKEDVRAQIREKIEDKLAEYKDRLNERLIAELSDMFDVDLTGMDRDEIIDTLNPILDAKAFEKGDEWIAKLSVIKKIAGLLKADTDCIDNIIACIEGRMGNHADLLARTITVNFPGVEGVTVGYVTNGVWTYLDETFNDTCTFVIASDDISVNGGYDSVWVGLGGMFYQFDYLTLYDCDEFDVPVIPLRVYGVNAPATLNVVQNGFVYSNCEVAGGVQTLFNVFDNGSPYTVMVSRDGFYHIEGTSNRTMLDGVEELHAYFGGPFYNISVPAGIDNVQMWSYGWITQGAAAGDTITLLKNGQTAYMYFDFDGTTQYVEFPLDGTNPFAGQAFFDFYGLDDVSVQHYTNGVWSTFEGLHSDNAQVKLPAGTTSVRVVKAGMYYQWDGVSVGDRPLFFVAPLAAIEVAGINQPGKLAIVQGSWVYNYTPATPGVPNEFLVFDNGRPYEVRYWVDASGKVVSSGLQYLVEGSYSCWF